MAASDAPVLTKEVITAYLATHKIEAAFQGALQHVASTQPKDPLKAAAKFLLEECDYVHQWDVRG